MKYYWVIINSFITVLFQKIQNQPESSILKRDYLLNSNDEFFILKDLPAYAEARKEIVRRYMDKTAWVKSCIINIARSGIFSSDRTIAEYAKDIWDVKPVDVQPLTHE